LYRYTVSQSSEFCRHNPLCCLLTSVCCCLFRYDSDRKLLDKPLYGIQVTKLTRLPRKLCILGLLFLNRMSLIVFG